MSVKFYAYNLIDQDITKLVASENIATHPIDNLKDPRRTKKYRSETNNISIVIDLINPQPVDSILLADDPIQGFNFDTPILIEANATDTWGAPAFSTSLVTKNDSFGIAYKELATPENYRFWKLTFTSSQFVEISTLFLGKRIEFTSTGIDYGWTYQEKDLLKKSSNRYAQEFIDDIGTQKLISASMRYLNKDEFDQASEVIDYNRSVLPFFFRVPCDILNDPDRFSGYFRFRKKPTITNSAPSLYDFPFNLVEAL